MENPPFQFGLKAIFCLTALIAFGFLLDREPDVVPAGAYFALPLAGLAKLIGRDNTDATCAAVFGFMAGAVFWLSLPVVH
jgi:hypothetical protein